MIVCLCVIRWCWKNRSVIKTKEKHPENRGFRGVPHEVARTVFAESFRENPMYFRRLVSNKKSQSADWLFLLELVT